MPAAADTTVGTATDPGRALLRWLHAVDIPDTAVLACRHTALPAIPIDAVGIRVEGCLADAGVALPAQLLASGVNRIEVCGCEELPDAVELRIASWQRVFAAVGPAGSASPRRRSRRSGPVFEMSRPSVSRRSLFGVRSRCEAPFDLSGDEAARGVAALRILHREGRLRLDLAAPAPADSVAIAMHAVGCTACGVCVRACPHDALELVETNGISVLRHHQDTCRADQQCVRLCPETALSVIGQLTLSDLVECAPVELARVATVTCPRCRVRHPATDGELCATCQFRTANPFGSQMPPGHRS